MPATAAALKPTSSKPQPASFTRQLEKLVEMIRARAYRIYEERGRLDGHELDDWLQAEAELRAEWSKRAAA